MKMKLKKEIVFGMATALTLAMAPFAMSQVTVAEASVISACGKLFAVDANAAGMTAQERAAIIQKNLDYAIIHAKNRTPSAVNVLVVNRNPVVVLDGFHIATADGNSAARHRMSQMQLAEEWASTIKFCLADSAAIERYLSMLTGQFPQAAAFPREERMAYARAGLYMPVKLLTPVNSETSQMGDCIKAQLTTDVPLPTSQTGSQYEAYLPAGTIAMGQLVDSSNSYLRKGALGIRFDRLQTPDGETVPINAHILGGIGTWIYFNTEPQVAEFSNILGTKLSAKNGLLAAKGNICGGWSGYPIGAGLDVPFQKMVLKRRTGIEICAGEPMMLQLAAPTAIAVCTNCGPANNSVATEHIHVPVAIGGAGAL